MILILLYIFYEWGFYFYAQIPWLFSSQHIDIILFEPSKWAWHPYVKSGYMVRNNLTVTINIIYISFMVYSTFVDKTLQWNLSVQVRINSRFTHQTCSLTKIHMADFPHTQTTFSHLREESCTLLGENLPTISTSVIIYVFT